MNLYQKYRPLKWDEVAGHEKIVKELKERSKTKNWPQALYFTGNSGSGKTTLARLVAMSVKCSNLDSEGNPCGKCEDCVDIISENYSRDNYFFNASDVNIDEMRNLEDICITKTFFSSKKVIFIDEFQKLKPSTKAHDFFLTLLEKKNSNVIFILGSMEDSAVSKAIKRRTNIYYLRPLSNKVLGKYFTEIAAKEGVELDSDKIEVLLTIASNSGGSVGYGMSYLERCILSGLWTPQELEDSTGLVSEKSISIIVGYMLQGNVEELGKILNDFSKDTLVSLNDFLIKLYLFYLGVQEDYNKELIKLKTNKITEKTIEDAIEEISKILKNPYLTYYDIKYTLFKICASNAKDDGNMVTAYKKRRKKILTESNS